MQSDASATFGKGYPNSDSAFTAIKPASLEFGASNAGRGTRRRSNSWGLRITAPQPGEGVSGLVPKPIAKRVNRTLKRVDEVLRKRWHHDIWEIAAPGPSRYVRGFVRRLQRLWMCPDPRLTRRRTTNTRAGRDLRQRSHIEMQLTCASGRAQP